MTTARYDIPQYSTINGRYYFNEQDRQQSDYPAVYGTTSSYPRDEK